MNKKITIAMLLLLMQTVMYSGQTLEGEDWMAVERTHDGELRLRVVQAAQPTQNEEPSTAVCNQENLQEGPEGICAAVTHLLEVGLKFLGDQAYGKAPFGQQNPASREKNN